MHQNDRRANAALRAASRALRRDSAALVARAASLRERSETRMGERHGEVSQDGESRFDSSLPAQGDDSEVSMRS